MAATNGPPSDSNRPAARWQTRSGAVLFGSIVGLGIAFLVAALLVLLVPDDETEADADDGDDAATETPDDETVPTNFTGTWVTNFATAELTQEGTTVTGDYSRFLSDKSPRMIEGTVTDRTLDGTFDGPNPLRFQMANDGSHFMGHWADPQGGLHEWCGSLALPLPDGCGYSGEWLVKGFPPAAALEDDTILMSQYGDIVTMRFDSTRHGEVDFDLAFDGTTLALATGTATLSGGLQIQFQFLVTEDPDWNTLRGTWRSGNDSGQWCAALEDSDLDPPC